MIVRTPCGECGTVSILPAAALVELAGAVLYQCPRCSSITSVPLAPRPEPPGHPESPRPGPLFTMDDLIDFHELLHGRRRLAELS